jgi:hypothetical protein
MAEIDVGAAHRKPFTCHRLVIVWMANDPGIDSGMRQWC